MTLKYNYVTWIYIELRNYESGIERHRDSGSSLSDLDLLPRPPSPRSREMDRAIAAT